VTAPALPEIFGNYSLGDFNEVVSPEAISWWPQTVGWAWVAAGLLILAGYHSWKRAVYWYRNRYRGEAINKLRQLPDSGNTAMEVNRLLKLTALAAFSREQVASLSGQQWVAFLNAQCPEPVFDSAQSELLALAAYTGEAVEAAVGRTLLQSSRAWIEQHKNPYDV
jgi:uncharacterized protein DUF4381